MPRRCTTRSTARAYGTLALLLAASCLRSSPFQSNLTADQSDLHAKSLARLRSTQAPPVIRIAFITDTHQGLDEFGEIVDRINERGVDVVLHGGDITDFGTMEEYVWTSDHLLDLDAPFFVTAGNHDELANGRTMHEKMFGPLQSSFVWGSVKVILFDTNTIELHEAHLELPWLQQQIADKQGAKYAIVVTHHPPNSRPHILVEDETSYLAMQRDGGVVLNLNGHIHDDYYAVQYGATAYVQCRTALKGFYYFLTLDQATGAVTVEACNLDGGCAAPVSPVAPEPGTTWPPPQPPT